MEFITVAVIRYVSSQNISERCLFGLIMVTVMGVRLNTEEQFDMAFSVVLTARNSMFCVSVIPAGILQFPFYDRGLE
jgi:hypothetical protein